ncbi:hypothetical protein QCA50_010197 [Cerrena zonata]|uniref:Uncharacterized protein n=1 Tax=Cerrena zonata TaxID=2478898 RepID=A0AAW0G503_9APHY
MTPRPTAIVSTDRRISNAEIPGFFALDAVNIWVWTEQIPLIFLGYSQPETDQIDLPPSS